MSFRQDDRTALSSYRSDQIAAPLVAMAFLALLILVFLVELSMPTGTDGGNGRIATNTLIALGSALRPLVIGDGQAFRLITAVFLHASWGHLLANGIVLFFLGVLLEKRIGRAWFAAIFLLSGLAGTVASISFNPPNMQTVGASGATMGLLATAFALTFHEPFGWKRSNQQLGLLRFLIPGLIPFFLQYRGGGVVVDYASHLGGAVIGGLLGVWLLLASRWQPQRPSGRAALIVAFLSCLLLLPIGARGGIAFLFLVRSSATESDREAVALVSRAIDFNPDLSSAHYTRGYLRFGLGQYQAAVIDLERSVRLDPAYGYDALLLHVLRARLGATDSAPLAAHAARIDKKSWPAPIFAMFLGQLPAKDLPGATTARDPGTLNGQLCEARFYMAEFSLLRGDRGEGKALLQSALAICPADFVEARLAQAELKRLNP